MNKLFRPFTILVIATTLLTSCGLFGSSSSDTPAAAFQSTAVLEFSGQIDTSVPYTTVGQSIRFNFAVKNSGQAAVAGNVVINGITSTCQATNTVNNLNDSLDPGETVTCIADYVLTQADLDRGSVNLIATATLNGINSNQVTVNVPVGMPKVLVAGVTANTATYTAAAQVITFTYSIKNGGAAALGPDQFRITSSLAANQPAPCGNPNILIAPNETITCQVQYAISAADMNAASIVNQVTASGGGVSASQPASVTLTKGAVPNQSTLTPGSTIQHTVSTGEWLWHIARCYGADPNAVIQANRQLADPAEIERGMVLTIPNIGSRGTIYGLPCVVQHTVAAGETWASIAQLYNADPNILQMIKANTLAVGSVMYVPKNSAGSGATLPVARNLSLTVSASQTTYDQTGQQIVFTYLLKNTGNTTLGPDQFKVTDTLIGTQPFNCGDPGTTLAPGTTLSCTSTYTISQADMNVASISNVATALGGAAQSQATGVTLNRGARSLSLAVTASTAVYGSAGQQITFTYVIKNNGTSTLGPAQFTISDALFGTTPLSCGAANTTLAPNATVTCAYVYTITAADMTVTSIINLATASGGGAGPSSAVSVTITRQ